MEKEISIDLEQGLDPRNIALFVQIATQYASKIYVEGDVIHVNAKSIMGMMSLKPEEGERLKICARGEDAEEAVNALQKFLCGNE